jgi:hypothetical protein
MRPAIDPSIQATVSPENAPLRGICGLCDAPLTRASFCCGCGRFVCWTHGEPHGLKSPGGIEKTYTPHPLDAHGRTTKAA